jgi:outer membrane receptor protein involved in Fe transport
VSDQFWADNNRPNPATAATAAAILVPAVIPAYTVFNLSAEVYLAKNVRLFGGISNLGDEKYYSRVFLNGLIDPAPQRTGYAGLSVEF